MEKARKKLILAQETLRNLTAGELRNVVGGFLTSPMTACNCTTTQPQTCQHSVCFGTCQPGEIPND